MIINISADTVVWFIAVMLVVLSVLLFFTLMAIRALAFIIQTQSESLKRKIPNLGGGGDGGAEMGGLGGVMQLVSGLFGGGK